MFKDLETPQKVFFYILFALTAVALGMGILAGYNLMLVAKPKTLGVSYATTLATSSGETPICKVEIWENVNNNGLEAYEIQFNSYTDAEGSWVKGFGLQVVGSSYGSIAKSGLSTLSSSDLAELTKNGYFMYGDSVVFGEWYSYQTDDLGDTTYKLDLDKIQNNLYIDIEGKYYQIVLNPYQYLTTHRKWYGKKYTKTHNTQYSFFDLATYIIDSAKYDNGKVKYETYYIDMLECSPYYHLLYQNNKGQYKELDDVTDLKNYLQIEITYHADGLTDATQSMFGQVRHNPSWNYWEGTAVEDFWSVATQIYLTENDITTIEANGNYYITINSEFASYLKSLSNAELYVNINLDNIDISVSGILMDNFIFKTKEFNITSSTSQAFEILNPNTINTPALILGGA